MRSRLIVGVLGLGGVAFGLSQGLGPFHDQMAKAVTALGGDASKLPTIQVKSLRHTYDDVLARITKLGGVSPAGVGSTPAKPLDYSAMNKTMDLLSAPGVGGPTTGTAPATGRSQLIGVSTRD
jgi:hypothetical protein